MSTKYNVYVLRFQWISGGWDVDDELLGVFSAPEKAMDYVRRKTGQNKPWTPHNHRLTQDGTFDEDDGKFVISSWTLNEGL